MNPGDIVPLSLQPDVVALSFLIAFFGSYVALVAAARIRASVQDGANVRGFVLIAAVSMGGIGIWGMHFIGMQAQRMPFEVGYALWLTLLSAAVAVAFSGMAFWYVGRQAFGLGRCVVAGVLAGLGVAAMHYIGIGAMRMPAVFLWNAQLVALSVAVAVASAVVALWLAFNVQREWQRVAAAAVMGLAVCGMHYTGAAAGVVVCTTAQTFADVQVGGVALPYVAFAGALAVLLAMRWQLHRSNLGHQDRTARRIDALLRETTTGRPVRGHPGR
ncbi:MHYT domain-containing protein [Bordetella genomosp. 6]|uniref:MHYT domain-containing protein n=1 Tax=Bordetella genomosp. 6 TaxID=463024 RepID=UPI00142DEDB8|nr:MHYT domain-containing protein [Bordetella genomosp. 6]